MTDTKQIPTIKDLDGVAQVVLDLFDEFERVDFTIQEKNYILIKASAINSDPDDDTELQEMVLEIAKNSALESRS